MEKIVNILHLSDLHFTKKSTRESHNIQVVTDAFLKDLGTLCSDFLTPDLVVFSGDLVRQATEDSIHIILYDSILDKISKIVRCNTDRMIFCPGNHDANQERVKEQSSTLKTYRQTLISRDTLNDAYLNGHLTDYVNNVFSEYNELCELIDYGNNGASNSLVSVRHFDDLGIDFVILNTAWMSGAGLKTFPDYGNLTFPEAALYEGIQQCRDEHYKILVSHHPATWLAEFVQGDFIRLIDEGFDAHLFGHMHDPMPRKTTASAGTTISHQSGALYAGRERYIGYALISIEMSARHSVFRLRSYSDMRREFYVGNDAIKSGMFYSDETSKAFWHSYSQRIDKNVLSRWICDALLPTARVKYNEGLIEKRISDVFVSPPMFTRDMEGEPEADPFSETAKINATIDMIVNGPGNYILHGRAEYGKTTLLNQIALNIIETYGCTETPSVPILISFEDIKLGRDNILRTLGGAVLETSDQFNVKQLLSEGLIVVLIDDIDYTNTKKIDLLREFLELYPYNRYIFSTLQDTEIIVLDNPVARTLEGRASFNHVFLEPFTRNNIRRLVKKWGVSGTIDENTLITRLTRVFTSMNLPVTAANGTILLSIYERQEKFRPINRAALIERFVEHLLEKRLFKDAFRGAFDYDLKVRVLAHLAGWMAENDKYILSYDDTAKIIQSFFNQKGLALDAKPAIDLFVDTRILRARLENQISFRYRAFLEYFIARLMSDRDDFKSWVLDPQRYLSFLNEILYYAGLNRSEITLLELIGDRFKKLTVHLREDLAESGALFGDLQAIEDFVLPGIKEEGDDFAELKRQMQIPELTEKEQDEILDVELPKDSENRQEVFRPIFNNDGTEWNALLLLYSGVLNNLEVVDDGPKRQHLRSVLEGWGYFTLHSMWAIPILAKDRRITINGVQYQAMFPTVFSDKKVARLISVEIVNVISRAMSTAVGTEKLERQLTEPELDEPDEPLIIEVYRTMLIADLRLKGWTNALEKLVSRLGESRFLMENLIRKLRDISAFDGHSAANKKQLQEIGAEIYSTLSGEVGKQRLEEKSKTIQRLNKQELVRRLKIRAADFDDQ